jgi:hypothetical protein
MITLNALMSLAGQKGQRHHAMQAMADISTVQGDRCTSNTGQGSEHM